jgi:hypothetical protein
MRKRVIGTILGLALVGCGFSAALALASPTTKQYDTPTVTTVTTQTQGVGGIAANPTTPTPSGTLPFTGMQLLWVVVLGAGLVLLGMALRRRGRRSSS